jgi:hypothetical protein
MSTEHGIAIILSILVGGCLLGLLLHALLRRFLSPRGAAGATLAIGLPLVAAMGVGVGVALVGGWLLLSEAPRDED